MHKATWHRTLVAVKVLRASDEVALGDFRCAGDVGDQGVGLGEFEMVKVVRMSRTEFGA